LPVTAYGTSKAAVNFIARRLHHEHHAEGFVIFPIRPGWVATDLGKAGAKAANMEVAPITVEESVVGLARVIKSAGKEQSGKLLSYDDTECPW
jgi:norsolorinic acid ketoreductase